MKFAGRELGLGDFAAAQAVGADAHALRAIRHFGLDRPQVHVPAATARVVRVADVVTGLRPFAADLTNLCHELLQTIAKLAG